MALLTKSDLDNYAKQVKAQYGKNLLGAFKNGKMLHNNADHPEHANYDMLDHMRASSIHSKMAGEKESSGQHIRAAHHREQAAKHRAKWKSMTPDSPFIKKSDERKPPKISIVPHPAEVIDVEPTVIDNMKRRLSQTNDATSNTIRLLEAVRHLTANRKPDSGPPYVDEEFKNKLDGIIKKAQYVPHEGPEYSQALPAKAKTSQEQVKNIRPGRIINKPKSK